MKVHLITSKDNLDKTIDTLRRIIKVVYSKDGTFARDWVEPAYMRYSQQSEGVKRPPVDWKAVQKDNMEAIAKADVIIAEATQTGFGVGYQLAYAVQQKKPVLILRSSDANKDSFASGIDNVNVQYREYNANNLEKIVGDFLDENEITVKDMRFNFFIDRPIYNYLRWASLKTGKTKAEILRELVQQEIDKKES